MLNPGGLTQRLAASLKRKPEKSPVKPQTLNKQNLEAEEPHEKPEPQQAHSATESPEEEKEEELLINYLTYMSPILDL